MATHDYVIDNSTGANVRADINNVLQAILTNNSSSSAPSTTAAYMWWADTNAGVLKIRNSANNGWVELLQLDGTLTLEDGSNSAPALAFRDDLDTGIFSSAADTFNVATGGVERMELGTTTIFNETGADVDFRIESDDNANMFFVDASEDRVGIGTSSPSTPLHVVGTIHGSTNIGIRTTSPSNNLHIHQDDSDKSIAQFTNTATGTASGDGFQIGLNSSEQGLINMKESASILFKTADSDAMTIDSSQRVGIGTTSPTASTAIFGGTQNCLMVAGSAAPQIRIASDTSNQGDLLLIAGNSGADCTIANAANNGDLLFSTNSSGAQGTRFKIDDSGKCFMPEVFNRTSGSAVNMRVDSDGELRRSTSSKRYKKCITDAPWGLAEVLKLKPITYKSNASGKDANDKIFGGFTAEDVHDIGLTEFVDYNDDNEPDAIAYGNMVSLATKAIQELSAKVTVLETKVATLESA